MRKIVIYSPSRLAISVLNMNKFSPGILGGGGIGLSPSHYSKIILSPRQSKEDYISSPNRLVVIHFLDVFRHIFSLNNHYSVIVSSDIMPHSGEGSTNSIILGLIKGLLHYHQIKLSDSEIFELYVNNVMEEHSGNLVLGYESGVGTWSILKGGMVFLDDNSFLARSIQIDSSFQILIVRPKHLKRLSFQMESSIIDDIGKEQDCIDYPNKLNLFFGAIDLTNNSCIDNQILLFRALSGFRDIGSKVHEIAAMNALYDGLYDSLIAIGNVAEIKLHCLSSLGPTYFYVDDKEHLELASKKINQAQFHKNIYSFSHGIAVLD